MLKKTNKKKSKMVASSKEERRTIAQQLVMPFRLLGTTVKRRLEYVIVLESHLHRYPFLK